MNRKYKLLIIVFIISVFSFISMVSAEDYSKYTITRTYQVSAGSGKKVIYGSDVLTNLYCGSNKKLVTSASSYVAQHTKVSSVGGTYYIEALDASAAVGTHDELTCYFDYIHPLYNENNGSSISSTAPGTSLPGTIKLVIDYVDFSGDIEYNFTLNKFTNKAVTILGPQSPFNDYDRNVEPTIEFVGDAEKYIGIRKNNGYDVVIKDNIGDVDGTEARVNVTYKDKNSDRKYTIRSIVRVYSTMKIFAHPGQGTCSFGSEWTKAVINERAEPTSVYSHALMRKYSGGKVSLPNCSVEENHLLPIEFAGWVVNRRNSTTLPVDICMKDKNFVAKSGSSTSVDIDLKDPRDYRDFVACYKTTKKSVIIYPDYFNIDVNSASGWGQYKDFSGTTYYYASLGASNSVQMPKAFAPESRNVTVIGYAKQGNSCSSRNIIKQGESVVEGGSYKVCARVGKDGPSGEGVVIEKEEDLEISVYSTQGSTNYVLSDYGIAQTISCSSEDDKKVSAKMVNGDCMISAEHLIKDGARVKVFYKGKATDGTEYHITYNVNVTGEELIETIRHKEGKVSSGIDGSLVDENLVLLGGSNDSKNVECSTYTIKPVSSYRQDNGIYIGKMKWKTSSKDNKGNAKSVNNEVTLRGHVYYGTATCNNDERAYVGICLDPGRQEPGQKNSDDSNNYIKEKDIDPGEGKYMDNLVSVIYKNSKDNLNKVTGSGDITIPDATKNKLAAATFALRIMSIELKDDSNNSGLGLSEYHMAYKKIASIINSELNASSNKDALRKMGALENKSYTILCDSKYKVSDCDYTESIVTTAFKWLSEAATMNDEVKPAKAKITVTTTKKESKDNKLILYGNISGLKDVGDFFTLAKYCPICENDGILGHKIKVEMKIGRESNHLVNYSIANPNLVTVTYKDYEKYNQKIKNWEEYETKWKNSHLYNDSGVMFFKITLYGINLETIARQGSTKGKSRGGSSADVDWNFYLRASTKGGDASGNTAIAIPTDSSNIQRMVVFSIPGKAGSGDTANLGPEPDVSNPKDTTTGALCYDDHCDAGADKNRGVNADINGSAELDIYGQGYGPATYFVNVTPGDDTKIPIDQVDKTVNSVLPSCNMKIDELDYTKCTNDNTCKDFNGIVFAAAGCCSMITDKKNSEAYKRFCTSPTCMYETVSSVCMQKDESNADHTEFIKLREGVQANGDSNMTCVYDNKVKHVAGGDSVATMANKKDVAGNTYELESFKNNKVCSVYCKEDWNFKVPDVTNFIGVNAIKAGSFFAVRHNTISSVGKRTCVTSNIKVSQIVADIENWSEKQIEAFNAYKLRTAVDKLKNFSSDYDVSETKTKYCTSGTFKQKKYNECVPNDSGGTTCTHVHGCSYTAATAPTGYTCTQLQNVEYDDSDCEESDASLKTCYTYTVSTGVSIDQYELSGSNVVSYPYTKEVSLDISNSKTINTTTGEGDCQQTILGKNISGVNTTDEAKNKAKSYIDNYLASDNIVPAPEHEWTYYRDLINRYTADLRKCQRFVLTSSESALKTGEATEQDFEQIYSYFNPNISYEYEEAVYGPLLNGKNHLVKTSTEKELRTLNYYSADEINTTSYTYKDISRDDTSALTADELSNALKTAFADQYNDDDDKRTLRSDYSKFGIGAGALTIGSLSNVSGHSDKHAIVSYCTQGGSGTGFSGGNKEEGGHLISWSSEPGCYTYGYSYVEGGDYVKATIAQYNEYKSEYKWYLDELKNYKYVADSANNAAISTASPNKEPDAWVPIGTNQESSIVFPTAINAKRGLYQYAFRYSNIGMYNNEVGQLGRLMGNTNSVVLNNTRTCFYEVVEELCTCCADFIDTEVVAPSNKSTTKLINEACEGHRDDCIVKSTSTPIETEAALEEAKSQAQFNLVNTSVSLGSIKENIGREVGSNWSNNDQYNLLGKIYITDKGAKLLDTIENKGEEIYSNQGNNVPEYSYTLTPSGLSAIRQYGDDDGYDSDREKAKGSVEHNRILVNTDSTNWTLESGKTTDDHSLSDQNVFYTHWKSSFLAMPQISNMETVKYKDRLLTSFNSSSGSDNNHDSGDSGICYIKAEAFEDNKLHLIDRNDICYNDSCSSKGGFYDDSGKPKCRWVDFVGTVGQDVNGNNTDMTGKKYRLAFK